MEFDLGHAASAIGYTACLAAAHTSHPDDGAFSLAIGSVFFGIWVGYKMTRNIKDPEVQELGRAVLAECSCALPATLVGTMLIGSGLLSVKAGCAAALVVNEIVRRNLLSGRVHPAWTATIPNNP